MRIAASNVQLSGSHKREWSASVTETVNTWGIAGRMEAARMPELDTVRISAANALQAGSLKSIDKTEETPFEISDEDKLKIKLIEQFLRQLTGKDIKIRIPDKLAREDSGDVSTLGTTTPQSSESLGLSIVYNKTITATQSESSSFAANAFLTTEDGRQMSIQIMLALKRSTSVAESTTIRLGEAKAVDPLVLNFTAASASATANKFTFDLNADGAAEQVSFVGPGSGLLALDLNRDGTINSGGELFGPISGNGFSDLAAYDADNNQWIDENDSIFDRLQIWVKDENGADRLFALAGKGIGAIYLGNVEAPFTLQNAGSIDATIRHTGIFVREDGTAGTIQHVDMEA